VQQNKKTMALTTCPECGREVSDTAQKADSTIGVSLFFCYLCR